MAKESVIVFAGEDKFIAKKEREFNKATGFSNLVGADGQAADSQEITPNPLTPPDKVQVPSSSDADFCEKAQQFISTNGNGTATPDEVMMVYNAFQANCQRPTPDVLPSLLTTDWESLSCDDIVAKIKELEELLMVSRMPQEQRARYEAALERGKMAQVEKCGMTPPALPDLPPPPPRPVTPQTGVVLSGLGVPPSRGGGAASGGGGAKEEKKKSNWWIWVLVAAGAYLLLSRDKNN